MTQQKPSSLDYFAALQNILKLQQEVLTKVLPHSGERGSNVEEYLREFLKRTLPKRYSVGTGFVTCSTPGVDPSFQTDIIIFDEFYNSPLFRELSSSVFAVETVYAAIEVKSILQKKDIQRCVEATARIRRLAKEKRYIDYEYKKADNIDKRLLVATETVRSNPPRTFIVAFDTDFKDYDSLIYAFAEELTKRPEGHIHGCVVLSTNWFFSQATFEKRPGFAILKEDGLMRFLNALLTAVSSMPMDLASMGRYFTNDKMASLIIEPEDESAEDPFSHTDSEGLSPPATAAKPVIDRLAVGCVL